jgi:fibronectin-binding autotransporter adhesin
MQSVYGSRKNGRRMAATRAGLLAVSAAVAGISVVMTTTARADITVSNPFSNFATPDIVAATNTGIGYSAGGTSFETTNGTGGNQVLGLDLTQQTISSFDVSFTLTASGGADGGAFVIDANSGAVSGGATTVVGGGGSSGGYDGLGNGTFGLQWEYYNGNLPGTAVVGDVSRTQTSANGSSPAYAYTFSTCYNSSNTIAANQITTGIPFQGANVPSLNSGDPMQFNLAYFGTTLTETVIDTTTHRGITQIFSNINIPSIVGASTAYVGFSGATGGATSTQNISNFSLVSNKTYAPIAIASGYNYKGIIPVGGSLSSITATQDDGKALGGDTWYEQGFDSAAPTTGLPASGSLFTSQADSAHKFQMQPYSSNDVVLISSQSADGPQSATITFTSQIQQYNALSFLLASGNGPVVLGLTINYGANQSGGTHAPSTGLTLLSPDWFSGSPSAWLANGRYSTQFDNVGSGNPNLFEDDVVVPDNADPVASVTLSYLGGNSNNPGNTFIFAISGEAGAAGPSITYTGAAAQGGGVWNTVNDNFNGMSGSIAVAVNFVQGDTVTFDDTAVGPHLVNVAASGMNVNGWNINTSTGYTFTGQGIGGFGGLTLTGSGPVVLANSNTFTGPTIIANGLLQLNSSGALASSTISVSPGATFNISNGAQLTAASLTLVDNGTVNVFNPTLKVGQLTGVASGIINLNGTALTLAGIDFSGTIAGTSGSVIFTGGGTFDGMITDGSSSPIAVTYNDAGTGTTLIMTKSNSYSGGTSLVAGAMEIDLSTSLGSGAVHLQGGALGSAAGTVNFSGLLAGGPLIVPAGSAVLEISNAANTFNGPIVIQTGATLQIDSAGAIAGINGANSATGTITVASGASLLVNDTTGTLGLTGGLVGGAPITAVISGTGVGGYGAIQGPISGSGTWAGNINASGPATISPGSAGSLTLTGAIGGTGPILFASASNDSGGSTITISPPTAASNNYTGESQVAGDYGVYGTLNIVLGNNNALSPASGLDFVNGGPSQTTVDLMGFNQSLQYLSGTGNSSTVLTNSNGNIASTLTITSPLRGGVPAFCGTTIQGNLALVVNDPTGLGNQVLTGTNTYTGGTTIIKGTLTAASAMALSSGPVTLKGGTLALATPGTSIANSTPILTPTSLTTANVKINEGNANTFAPNVSGNSLTITTDGATNIANSVFFNTKVPVSDALGFTAQFNWNISGANLANPADGIAFVLQNDPRGASAVGGTGGNSLAYAGNNAPIVNSAAALFEVYGANKGVAFGSGGNLGTYVSTSPVNLNQSIGVTLVYNGPAETLTETLVGVDTTTFTTTFTGIDYSSLLGGAPGGSTTAYLGFTGATGSITTTQTISNFSYSQNLPFSQTPTSPNSIGNLIVAASGTSAIQIGVSTSAPTTGAAVGGINISSGATVNVTVPAGSTLRGVLFTPTISIAPTGKLDLGGNELDLTAAGGMTLGQVTALLKTGYNNGAWNGPGIASSAANANPSHLTALGVIVNDTGAIPGGTPGTSLYGAGGTIASTFEGSTPADGDILVKYTYYGDANLDGKVDGSDYSLIDNGFMNHLTGWSNGDFNYDGVVDGSDYTLIDNAFNTQSGAPLAQIASSIASVGGGSAVPEPTTLSLLAIGSAGLLSRRRRKH